MCSHFYVDSKEKENKPKLIEDRMVIVRGAWGMGKMGKDGQKEQTSNYKYVWGCSAQQAGRG